MHSCLMEKIIKDGKKEGMDLLGDVFNKAMEYLEEHNEEKYEDLEMCLYEGAYGKVLTEEKAREIIMDMHPYGMKWTIDQTKDVQKQFGMTDMRDVDFWIVMNMAYNDYHDLFDDDVEMYMKYAKNFIKDEDAKEGKVYTYFTRIPR